MGDRVAVPACTGACCESLTLGDLTHAQLQAYLKIPGWREVMIAKGDLGAFLEPAAQEGHFNCLMFNKTTRQCVIYSLRPETCKTFPKNILVGGQPTSTCPHCGHTCE